MLTVVTDKKVYQFNLSTYEIEKKFKEAALNETIDQTGKSMRARFRHAEHELIVKELLIPTKNIRKIDFEAKKFYRNQMYYSIKTLCTMEEVCR